VRTRPGRRLAAALGLLLLATLAGCAGSSRSQLHSDLPLHARPRIAVLPLEDLSGEMDAAVGFSRLLYAEMVRTGKWEVVESGVVEGVMDSLSLRDGGSLSRSQVQALGARLAATHLLTGTMLESDRVKTGDGDVPAVGVALKLVEVSSLRAVWAESRFHTGEDRETVFGWGRERDPQMVASTLAKQLVSELTVRTADSSTVAGTRRSK
jgi:TolB-like protein